MERKIQALVQQLRNARMCVGILLALSSWSQIGSCCPIFKAERRGKSVPLIRLYQESTGRPQAIAHWPYNGHMTFPATEETEKVSLHFSASAVEGGKREAGWQWLLGKGYLMSTIPLGSQVSKQEFYAFISS